MSPEFKEVVIEWSDRTSSEGLCMKCEWLCDTTARGSEARGNERSECSVRCNHGKSGLVLMSESLNERSEMIGENLPKV